MKQDAVGDISGKDAIVRTDAHGVKSTHTPEVQGWIAFVLLQNGELLVSSRAHLRSSAARVVMRRAASRAQSRG